MPITRKSIRQLREERGWTRRYLSVILDVTEGTIRYWEKDATEPQLSQQRKLMEVFGLPWEAIEWPDKARKIARAA